MLWSKFICIKIPCFELLLLIKSVSLKITGALFPFVWCGVRAHVRLSLTSESVHVSIVDLQNKVGGVCVPSHLEAHV